jgi:hypothetical protein
VSISKPTKRITLTAIFNQTEIGNAKHDEIAGIKEPTQLPRDPQALPDLHCHRVFTLSSLLVDYGNSTDKTTEAWQGSRRAMLRLVVDWLVTDMFHLMLKGSAEGSVNTNLMFNRAS